MRSANIIFARRQCIGDSSFCALLQQLRSFVSRSLLTASPRKHTRWKIPREPRPLRRSPSAQSSVHSAVPPPPLARAKRFNLKDGVTEAMDTIKRMVDNREVTRTVRHRSEDVFAICVRMYPFPDCMLESPMLTSFDGAVASCGIYDRVMYPVVLRSTFFRCLLFRRLSWTSSWSLLLFLSFLFSPLMSVTT